MAAATLQRLLPHWGDKIGEGAINTKPTTFLLSPTSTTVSSAAYLLSLLRHCADTPLAILSSSLPTGDYSVYSFRPQKKSIHYQRRRWGKQLHKEQAETPNTKERTKRGISEGEKNEEEEERRSQKILDFAATIARTNTDLCSRVPSKKSTTVNLSMSDSRSSRNLPSYILKQH
jgi:hypothetical protein